MNNSEQHLRLVLDEHIDHYDTRKLLQATETGSARV
jgi:hypothetical protein